MMRSWGSKKSHPIITTRVGGRWGHACKFHQPGQMGCVAASLQVDRQERFLGCERMDDGKIRCRQIRPRSKRCCGKASSSSGQFPLRSWTNASSRSRSLCEVSSTNATSRKSGKICWRPSTTRTCGAGGEYAYERLPLRIRRPHLMVPTARPARRNRHARAGVQVPRRRTLGWYAPCARLLNFGPRSIQ